jgi:hypothetical protein
MRKNYLKEKEKIVFNIFYRKINFLNNFEK